MRSSQPPDFRRHPSLVGLSISTSVSAGHRCSISWKHRLYATHLSTGSMSNAVLWSGNLRRIQPCRGSRLGLPGQHLFMACRRWRASFRLFRWTHACVHAISSWLVTRLMNLQCFSAQMVGGRVRLAVHRALAGCSSTWFYSCQLKPAGLLAFCWELTQGASVIQAESWLLWQGRMRHEAPTCSAPVEG